MRKGHKHAEASPICDKVVFNKVILVILIWLFYLIRICQSFHRSVTALSWHALLGKTRFRGQCKTYLIWSSTSCLPCRRVSESCVMFLCSSGIRYFPLSYEIYFLPILSFSLNIFLYLLCWIL